MLRASFVLVGLLVVGGVVSADDKKETKLALAGGKFSMTAPGNWVKKTPRVNIIEAEFSIPKADGDEVDGRLTVMPSGGGLEANISRWKGQFSKTKDSKVKKDKAGDYELYIVDLSGTFKDQRGPFAPATMRENYRMMGAIIVMEKGPNYFAKFYGPEKTVGSQAEKFVKFVKSFKAK